MGLSGVSCVVMSGQRENLPRLTRGHLPHLIFFMDALFLLLFLLLEHKNIKNNAMKQMLSC